MKKFKFEIYTIIRIMIVLSLCIVFGFIFGKLDLLFSQIIILSLIVLMSIELIRFVNNTNRDLKKFLNSIKYQDFSMSFGQKKLGRTFEDLSEAFADIIGAYRNVKIEKEAQLQLLQLIIDQIDVGIVAVEDNQKIIFINKKALEILNIPKLTSWNIDIPLIADIDKEVKEMDANGRKLLELQISDEIKQLAFHVNRSVFLEKELSLMTFQDIRSEIEQKEIEAWYKLIRILTHEVMNSITPLSSLTETILMLLENKDGIAKDISELNNEQLEDIRKSLKTIQGRSVGILEFVDAYRRLTNIPHPEFVQVNIHDLIMNVAGLLSADMEKSNIALTISVEDEGICVGADQHLMEQVLINLVSNSIYALEGQPDPFIEIRASKGKFHTSIEVTDNGKGISMENIDKIFIPFFSTREGGSGIGLSLSKQIVHLHHGRIKVRSSQGKGTTFRIEL